MTASNCENSLQCAHEKSACLLLCSDQLKKDSIVPDADNSKNIKKRKTLISSDQAIPALASVEETFKGLDECESKTIVWHLIESFVTATPERWDLLCKLENSMKCNPLDRLPSELSLYLFSFLDRRDLARAAQVCTQWKSIAYDRSLLLQKVQFGYLYCRSCTSLIGKDSDIICRKYRLDYSLAYHMRNMYNVDIGATEKTEFSTGIFNVALVACKKCKCEFGIKYINNLSGISENDQKVNTFLVKKKMLHLPGEPNQHVSVTCRKCHTDVGQEQNIISWTYRLRGFQAYQFTTLQNVVFGPLREVSYSSGNYTVSDTMCATCQEQLGIKYIESIDGENAFKIGTFLIEKPKVKLVVQAESRDHKMNDGKKKQQKKGIFFSLFSFLRKSN